MEVEERPSKLRKLSHNRAENDNADLPVLPQAQLESAPNADVENADESEGNADADAECANSAASAAELKGALDAQMERTLDAEGQPAEPVFSKNQLKKLKRKAEWEAGREDRKLKRKEKTKEKKARKRALRDEEAVEQNPDNAKAAGLYGNDIQQQPQNPGLPPQRRRQRLPIAFVIDCSFDDLMAEKEIISLGSQITRAYSDNSKAPFQAHLYVSSWTEESKLRKRFEGLLKSMYRNWKGMVFMEQDFVAASQMAEQEMRAKYGGKMVGAFERYVPITEERRNGAGTADSGQETTEARVEENSNPVDDQALNGEVIADAPSGQHTNGIISTTQSSIVALQEAGEVIYLTSDSPYTLTELKPYHTYIIGGLVDKNRHKGICYKTAHDKNAVLASPTTHTPDAAATTNGSNTIGARRKEIKTARLPIGEYMSMTARHVLATNHVVEIMLRWLEMRDWGQAFLSVMPKRKGGVLKDIRTEDKNEGEDEDDVGTTLEGKDEEQSDHEP